MSKEVTLLPLYELEIFGVDSVAVSSGVYGANAATGFVCACMELGPSIGHPTPKAVYASLRKVAYSQ
jgi:hypothetical protein